MKNVASYLLALLIDVFRHVVHLLGDMLSLLRIIVLKVKKKRESISPDECDSRISIVKEARNRRWSWWAPLALRRQTAIVVSEVIALALVTMLWPSSHPEKSRAPNSFSALSTPSTASKLPESGAQRAPKLSAESFHTACKRANKGETILFEQNPSLARGSLGSWDDFKVAFPLVLREKGEFRMWYRGCALMGSAHSCGIGFATSVDGINWKKLQNPVFVPPDPARSRQLNAFTLVHAKDRYLLWYSVTRSNADDIDRAEIHLATSKDGIAWAYGGLVHTPKDIGTWILEPSVLFRDETFHLWYLESPHEKASERLLHLTSSDGKSWNEVGSTPRSAVALDSKLFTVSALPSGEYEALFVTSPQNRVTQGLLGRLRSKDGSTWERAQTVIAKTTPSPEVMYAPYQLPGNGYIQLWFAYRLRGGSEAIGTGCVGE